MDRKRTRALESLAYHEAGHAVMAWLMQIPIRSASISTSVETGGRTRHSDVLEGIHFELPNAGDKDDMKVRLHAEKLVKVCEAGPLAQRKYYETAFRRYHGDEDRRRAHHVLSRIVGSERELSAYWTLLTVQAEQLLESNWERVRVLAEALLEKETLPGRKAREIIKGPTTA